VFTADEDQIRELLRSAQTVAVVGLSDKPDRDSYHVAGYLQRNGYRIIPINPSVKEVLGEPAYATLRDVPEPIDVVDVFRKAEHVPEVVADAIAVGARAVWLQEGITHADAADRARAAGLVVVEDRCILKEHHKNSRGRTPTHPRTV
jgi:predicted CoA-binding protein